MAKGFNLGLVGDKALSAAFDALAKGAQGKIVRPALREGAHLVRRRIRVLTPVSTGRKPKGRHLRDTFRVRALRRSRTRVGYAVVSGTREQLGISPKAKHFYPTVIEYRRKPYIRPATDQSRNDVLHVIGARLRVGIAQAVASGGKQFGDPESTS